MPPTATATLSCTRQSGSFPLHGPDVENVTAWAHVRRALEGLPRRLPGLATQARASAPPPAAAVPATPPVLPLGAPPVGTAGLAQPNRSNRWRLCSAIA
jgi:hypothetical protein